MVKLKLRFIQSFCTGFLAIALLSSSFFANAVIIESEVTSLGGSSYQYDFNVINNDLLNADFDYFNIYFDFNLFDVSGTATVSAPSGWSAITLASDPFLSLDGVFDALAITASPIALGDSLGGFSVVVDWIGGGTPPAAGNSFEVFDDFITFPVLAFGVTTAPVVIPPPNPIPEPGLLSLFGLALLFVGARKRLG